MLACFCSLRARYLSIFVYVCITDAMCDFVCGFVFMCVYLSRARACMSISVITIVYVCMRRARCTYVAREDLYSFVLITRFDIRLSRAYTYIHIHYKDTHKHTYTCAHTRKHTFFHAVGYTYTFIYNHILARVFLSRALYAKAHVHKCTRNMDTSL